VDGDILAAGSATAATAPADYNLGVKRLPTRLG
jgi:hypothetical protein